MTTLVSELYRALLKAGVDDATAQAAAKSVLAIEDKEHLATRADLLELKGDLLKAIADQSRTMVTALAVMTAIFATISGLLRFVP